MLGQSVRRLHASLRRNARWLLRPTRFAYNWRWLTVEGYPVNGLLRISQLIDALTERVGKAIIWLVLVVTLISAGNAVMRYTLNYSSNAWLEIQWYLCLLYTSRCV